MSKLLRCLNHENVINICDMIPPMELKHIDDFDDVYIVSEVRRGAEEERRTGGVRVAKRRAERRRRNNIYIHGERSKATSSPPNIDAIVMLLTPLKLTAHGD